MVTCKCGASRSMSVVFSKVMANVRCCGSRWVCDISLSIITNINVVCLVAYLRSRSLM